MADDTPQTPANAGDASKVQPKKETVRINLPPKPTAAPTVKIPAPAPAGGAKAAPAAAGATQKLPSAAPVAPKAPASGGAPRPAPAMAPRAKKSVPTISGADKGLAIAAVVISIAVVVQLFMLSGS